MNRSGASATGLAAVLALTLLGCSSSQAPSTGGFDGTSEEVAVPLGPREEVHGVPRGWRHDDGGARAAAIAYMGLSGDIALAGFITRRDLIGAMATSDFAAQLEADTRAQLATVTDDLTEAGVSPTEVVWSEVPLTARVTRADAATAEVEVWSVTVVGLPEVDAVPRQSWRTVAVELEWDQGDWRLSEWEARPGPTPALGPAPSIDTVQDLAEVTAWPPTWEVAR